MKYVWLIMGAVYMVIMYEEGVSSGTLSDGMMIGLPILYAAMIIADAIENVASKLEDIERKLKGDEKNED